MSHVPNGVHDSLAAIVRTEGSRILGTLVRTIGDLQLAEDAVQEATVRALREWPRTGVPANPGGWLIVAARHAAIDVLRRERSRTGKERHSLELQLPHPPVDSVLRDDQLRLIFTCCHPALALDAQVPLALRVLCGLSTAQIADVLLSSESAVAKRLTRTRTKIARAAIPYRVPPDEDLPARLAAVCAVVHALYTSSHTARAGTALSDADGCREAVRLARLVHELLPDEATPSAVLALLLLTDARRPARTDPAGEPIPLAEQDRGRWQQASITDGRALLGDSLRRTAGIADPYQLQAAIAAQHAVARSYDDTDWTEIVRLYDLLISVRPSASAALARAVAVAEAQGHDAGLRALDDLVGDGRLDASASLQRWHAVRGELLARAHRYGEAVAATRSSLTGDCSDPERRYRERRVAEWEDARGAG